MRGVEPLSKTPPDSRSYNHALEIVIVVPFSRGWQVASGMAVIIGSVPMWSMTPLARCSIRKPRLRSRQMHSVALSPLAEAGYVTPKIIATRIDIQIRPAWGMDFHAQAALSGETALACQPVVRGQQVAGECIECLGR